MAKRFKDLPFWETFERLCSFPRVLTNQDIANTLQVSLTTCENRIQEKFPGMTFSQFREKMFAEYKSLLLNKQLELALNGNTRMQEWLGKNYLGQRDSIDINHQLQPIELKYALNTVNQTKDVTNTQEVKSIEVQCANIDAVRPERDTNTDTNNQGPKSV